MNLEDIRAVQAEERNSDGIQDLSDTFYREVTDYIEELREERAQLLEDADDLYGTEDVRQLTHEIETAQEVAEAIYDRRLAKIVKHASLAAAGMATEETGLTEEEAALYADLVGRIEDHRQAMMERFAGRGGGPLAETPERTRQEGGGASARAADDELAAPDSDEGRPAPQPPPQADDQPSEPDTFDASEAMAGDSEDSSSNGPGQIPRSSGGPEARAAREGEDANGTDLPEDPIDASGGSTESESGHPRQQDADGGETDDGGSADDSFDGEQIPLRITEDVGEIMGVDEQVYDLAAGDLVNLPTANAEPLLDRDAAVRIE